MPRSDVGQTFEASRRAPSRTRPSDAHKSLSPQIAALLAEGGADRSVAEWRVIWGMVQSGWTPEHAIGVLLRPEYVAGEKLQRMYARSPSAAYKRFFREWRKAEVRIALNPVKDDPHEVHLAVAELRALAEEHAHLWTGQRTLDRLAFGYLLNLAAAQGSLTVRCGSRQLAIFLNCRQPTASAVLRRLTMGPLLSLARTAQGRLPAVYRLSDTYPLDCDVCRSDSVVRTPVGEATTESVLHTTVGEVHDAFLPGRPDRRSLGRTPALVWMTLDDSPVPVNDLALQLGKNRTTIKRALDRLQSAGFASVGVQGWVKTDTEPEAVANALGIPAVKQARIERFRRDRLDYEQHLVGVARQRYWGQRRQHLWHLEQQGRLVANVDLLPTRPLPAGRPLGVGQVGRVSVWFWKDGQYQVLDGTRGRRAG